MNDLVLARIVGEQARKTLPNFADAACEYFLQDEKAIGIPPRLWEAKNGELKSVHKMVKSGDDGVVLTGPPGRGKDWFAVALLQQLADTRRYSVPGPGPNQEYFGGKWLHMPTWMIGLRAAIGGRTNESEQTVLAAAVKPSVLVIEDLGSERETDYAAEILLAMVNQRLYFPEKYTVVTTNESLEDLARRNERLASRFGSFAVVKFSGPDLRLEGK